jgi:hypothetical protein
LTQRHLQTTNGQGGSNMCIVLVLKKLDAFLNITKIL